MRLFGICGSLGLFLAVALGAFGAHALKNHLSEEMLRAFETGVRYQAYHSLALILVGILVELFSHRSANFRFAGFAYLAGIILFSGSLYVLSITGAKFAGMLTPLGGLFFLAGHILLFI